MSHHLTQTLALEAEQHERAGERDRAEWCWSEAARLTWEYVQTLPEEKATSRTVYGMSAAGYFAKAGDFGRAREVVAHLRARPIAGPYDREDLEAQAEWIEEEEVRRNDA